MSVSIPNPSSRLLRAAIAERADVVRHRERLSQERARLLRELRELDDALAVADHRLGMLAELAGQAERSAPEADSPQLPSENATPADNAGENDDDRPVLRGPAIREAAVRALLAQPGPIEALHYRQWYDLLVNAGFRVAGKDSLAVFLTQLSRSPLVRKASAPGVYEVDHQAPRRIRHRLDRLQIELREVTVAAPGPIELGEVRARRHELDLAISQQERALEEALRVLASSEREALTPGAHAG